MDLPVPSIHVHGELSAQKIRICPQERLQQPLLEVSDFVPPDPENAEAVDTTLR